MTLHLTIEMWAGGADHRRGLRRPNPKTQAQRFVILDRGRRFPLEDERLSGVAPPSVIPRSDVPISSAPGDADMEVRPFVAHGLLRASVPETIGLAWTHAKPGRDVALRSHPIPGLLVILQGRAELTGRTRRFVEQGDVVTLPSHHEYGFASVGHAGLTALHVAFRKDPEYRTDEILSLEHLLARNEVRAQLSIEGPAFQLLRNGALDGVRSRARFIDSIRVFSDAFQTILLTRQATCFDEAYIRTFHEHFTEELGHNELLTVTENRKAPSDPVLRATSLWFCHQMLVLDNIGKAALVHLVLETAGHYFHTLAEPVLSADVNAGYFHVHAEADDDHKDVAIELLEGQHPHTYRRLHRIIEDGWDVFDTMMARVAHLVDLETSSS